MRLERVCQEIMQKPELGLRSVCTREQARERERATEFFLAIDRRELRSGRKTNPQPQQSEKNNVLFLFFAFFHITFHPGSASLKSFQPLAGLPPGASSAWLDLSKCRLAPGEERLQQRHVPANVAARARQGRPPALPARAPDRRASALLRTRSASFPRRERRGALKALPWRERRRERKQLNSALSASASTLDPYLPLVAAAAASSSLVPFLVFRCVETGRLISRPAEVLSRGKSQKNGTKRKLQKNSTVLRDHFVATV